MKAIRVFFAVLALAALVSFAFAEQGTMLQKQRDLPRVVVPPQAIRSLAAIPGLPPFSGGILVKVRFAGIGGNEFGGETGSLAKSVVESLRKAGIHAMAMEGEFVSNAPELTIDVTGIPAAPPGGAYFITLSVAQPVVTLQNLVEPYGFSGVVRFAVTWHAGTAIFLDKPSKEEITRAVLGLVDKYSIFVKKQL